MIDSSDTFDTGVRDSSGAWPPEPDWMSYSSLTEIELCPARWMLKRAHYPRLWSRTGYPDSPSLPAMAGDIIHATLDRVLTALVQNGCASTASAEAVTVLRSLGGYSALIQQAINDRVASLKTNPRTAERVDAFRAAFQARAAEMRQRVQAIVARSLIVPRESARRGSAESDNTPRLPIPLGSHAELDLQSSELRWLGRVDLLTMTTDGCEILDYKTGEAHESHLEQLRVYALLWSLDSERNPDRRPVTRLVASYRTREVTWPGPTVPELSDLKAQLHSRTETARRSLQSRPPAAHPSDDLCASCSVRQLCDRYWDFVTAAPAIDRRSGETWFGDVELTIERQHGPTSWKATVSRGRAVPTGTAAILRATREDLPFRPSQVWRFTNAAFNYDDETSTLVVSLHTHAEIFELEPAV